MLHCRTPLLLLRKVKDGFGVRLGLRRGRNLDQQCNNRVITTEINCMKVFLKCKYDVKKNMYVHSKCNLYQTIHLNVSA